MSLRSNVYQCGKLFGHLCSSEAVSRNPAEEAILLDSGLRQSDEVIISYCPILMQN
jgi:hypothetical protein